MTEKTKIPTESKVTKPASAPALTTFEALHRQIDRLFESFNQPGRLFGRPFFTESQWPLTGNGVPALDIAETDKSFEISAELPGLDEKNVEVTIVNGGLTIKGEKQEEKEEKEKNYYLHERHFGSFERSFQIPEGVDVDKIQADFAKGVLKVTLPKKPDAQKPQKKIEVKAA